MRKFVIGSALAAGMTLAACGGGGGGPAAPNVGPPTGGTPQPPPPASTFAPNHSGHYRSSGLPVPSLSDTGHMPVYRDERHIAVGVDQDRATLRSLPVVFGRSTIRYGGANDGETGEVIADFRNGDSTSGPFHRARAVWWDASATAEDRARVIRAVQIINAALPAGREIEIRPDARAVPLRFLSEADFIARFFGGWGYSQLIDGGGIWINRAYTNAGDRRATIVMTHELAHAFNLDHVPEAVDAILSGDRSMYEERQNRPQPLSLLYVADRDAIRVSDRWDDLGAWSSRSMHIAGQSDHAIFGVALRNGYGEPWAHGLTPATSLSGNTALSGTVTWEGELVGFTPQAQAVTGDAEVSVNLAGMSGTAAFTGMEQWTGAPGAVGSGTTWGDGDLRYTIAVRGNTFRETGGDAGRLTGIFAGRSHEAAGGTLERVDLTAAFGAVR